MAKQLDTGVKAELLPIELIIRMRDKLREWEPENGEPT